MSRILPTLIATTALTMAALALPMVPAYAAGPYDGTWVIDVPADVVTGNDIDPQCPALRLNIRITDNQVSGNWRRSYPEEGNVVENGNTNAASVVSGNVRADGALTLQWQNFHTTGQMVGNRGRLTMESECGPTVARARLLEDQTVTVASTATSNSVSASSASTTTDDSHDYNVYFAFDRAKLTDDAQAVVNAAVETTRANTTSRIALVGKADLSGTDPYNMALSERRADRVRDAMIAGGVAASRIDTRWVGERQPPVPTANGVHEAQNRVVQVVIQ